MSQLLRLLTPTSILSLGLLLVIGMAILFAFAPVPPNTTPAGHVVGGAIFGIILAVAFCGIAFAFRAFLVSSVGDAEKKRKLHAAMAIAHERNKERIPLLVDEIRVNPANKDLMQELVGIASSDPHLRQEVYSIALLLVEQTGGNVQSRVLALDAGRLYFSSLRPNGLVTTYDEQAINNDINMRTKTT